MAAITSLLLPAHLHFHGDFSSFFIQCDLLGRIIFDTAMSIFFETDNVLPVYPFLPIPVL